MDESAALEAWRTVVGTATTRPRATVSNPLWQVRAEDGREYVLKQFPEYPPGAGPVDEFRVVSFLQANGVPVAAPIVTDDGRIFAERNGNRFALLPHLPNDHGPHDKTTAYNVGAAIARLHQALAAYPWAIESFEDHPTQQLEETLEQLPEEVTKSVAPLTNGLREAIRRLPRQRTHGDCNTGNVLVHGREVSGFIDLDHLPIGPRVRDLGYYLASRFRDHDPEATQAVIGSYLDGYHDTNPLGAREREAVVPLVLITEIVSARWNLDGWTPSKEGFEQNVRTIEWLVAHYDELSGR